jgi:exopolysaccharide biosynthesis polyprenyl glycosylphosphotransferase
VSTIRIDESEVLVEAPALPQPRVRDERIGSPEAARIVASVGRAAVVLPAVLVPLGATSALTTEELVWALAAAGVWYVVLRGLLAAGRGVLGTGLSTLLGAAVGTIAAAGIGPLMDAHHPDPVALLGTGAGVFASAFVWERAVRLTGAERRRVLVVGDEELLALLSRELDDTCTDAYEIVAAVGRRGAGSAPAEPPFQDPLAGLTDVVHAQRPDLVVLTDEKTYGLAVERLLDDAGGSPRVVGLAGFFEHALGRVPVQHVTPAWFLSLVHLRQPAYGRWTKRTLDVVLASLGLALALPLLAAVALLVSRTPGPVLFRQTRLGERGRPFTLLKFRTMVADAEEDGTPRLACENDPRVIACGRLLRRTHLDELPQLWNVLRGDMSVVGPRPERPEFSEGLERAVPFWSRRQLVKPGVTGWAQVQCGYVSDRDGMADKLAYDLWYLRHQCLLLDLAICLRTVGLQLRALVPGATAKGVGR